MIAGQQITATLRLSRLLGQGGMGSVWVADHFALGTQVAVKFMAPAFAQDARFVERFKREAMAAAQIKSPHIAQVFDHGITREGMPYIVMELLEGEDLGHRVRRGGPLPPKEVAHIVGQAAKALTRAHQLGIVHRDIKADNIFLLNMDDEIFTKLLDFGVAKLNADQNLGMTATSAMVGTPLYMSPEQLLSAKHVDARSDLWSLAVVAYFAMTGRVPFMGETLGGLSVVIHAGVYAPVSALRPGIPLAVDAWFHRALQREPQARFASAREMAEELARAVGASGVFQSGAFNEAAMGIGASSPNLTPAGANSAPSGVDASSSKQTPTFGGTSKTGAGSPGRRVPTLILAAAVLALGAGVLLFFLRAQPSGPAKPSAAETASTIALSASAATPTASSDPITAPSAASASVDVALPAAPPTLDTAAPAPPTSAVSAARPTAGARTTRTAAPITPSKPATAKMPGAPTKTDTIGF